MGDKFSTVNIRLYLSPEQSAQEENDLRELLFGYSCPVNKDVEMYLREQAIEFTLKDQSVTYLVFSNINAELLGYFTIAVKPIIINAKNFSNHMKRKLSRSGEYDEITQTYSLAAYLVAQLGKNFA
ncbi:MAG: GNAT family acetyltransferase, partial [Acetatifactor sp.]